MSEAVYDSSDPRHVRKATKAAKLVSLELSSIMALPQGRRWVWSILSHCGTYQTPFSSDPYATAFLCGKQDVGHRLISDIMAECPELYELMQKENTNGRPSTSSRTSGTSSPDDNDGDRDSTFGSSDE